MELEILSVRPVLRYCPERLQARPFAGVWHCALCQRGLATGVPPPMETSGAAAVAPAAAVRDPQRWLATQCAKCDAVCHELCVQALKLRGKCCPGCDSTTAPVPFAIFAPQSAT